MSWTECVGVALPSAHQPVSRRFLEGGRRVGLLAMMVIVVWGCGETHEREACVDTVPSAGCSPLYTPTFTNVYEQTLMPHCAVNGSGCHELSASRGALGFGDQSETYGILMDRASLYPMVTPGEPRCSPLVVRLETSDPGLVMPPGFRLSAAERCAVTEWVRMGAHP